MKNTLLVVFLFGVVFTYGQKQANIWYFGEHAGLDFNSGVPVVLNNGQTHSAFATNIEGCASISDSSGALLFYMDGLTIYNRNHAVMMNGSGLLGGQSSSQACVILPKPNDPDLYYVFTTDDFISNLQDGLNYSVVDMCLDNGNGAVVA